MVCASLARNMTRWSILQDRRLAQLVSYLQNKPSAALVGAVAVGDLDGAYLNCFADADLCGDQFSGRSTSGGIIELMTGKGQAFVLDWWSRRQSAVATSTCESELASLSFMAKEHSLPMQDLWEHLLCRTMISKHLEDNMSCILVCRAGFSLHLRYLAKHSRLNLEFLKDLTDDESRPLLRVGTKDQHADGFTKGLVGVAFTQACQSIGLLFNVDFSEQLKAYKAVVK